MAIIYRLNSNNIINFIYPIYIIWWPKNPKKNDRECNFLLQRHRNINI